MQRETRGKVGGRAAVRLHIRMIGPKQSALARVRARFLDLVNQLVALIIALAGIAFRILVGEDGRHRLQHGGGGIVLGRYQAHDTRPAVVFPKRRRHTLPGRSRRSFSRLEAVETNGASVLGSAGRTEVSKDGLALTRSSISMGGIMRQAPVQESTDRAVARRYKKLLAAISIAGMKLWRIPFLVYPIDCLQCQDHFKIGNGG